MQLNDERAKAKLAALTRNVVTAAREGLKDAAGYMQDRITNQIINSPGSADPKKRPPHQPSAGKFVRRNLGSLVLSIQMQPTSEGKLRIYSNASKAPYTNDVMDWSRKKYGRTFMTIASRMYRKTIETIFAKEVGRAVNHADNLTHYEYQNNFPIS